MDWKQFMCLLEKVYGNPDERIDFFRANIILYVMRWILGIVLFFIFCYCHHGVFLSGIDYSGHGRWGWFGLGLCCSWTAIILSIAIMWVLGLTPLRRPRTAFFLFGLAFQTLFFTGLSAHSLYPIISEIAIGSCASGLLYMSLFVEE